jgi:hypothetical protein
VERKQPLACIVHNKQLDKSRANEIIHHQSGECTEPRDCCRGSLNRTLGNGSPDIADLSPSIFVVCWIVQDVICLVG